MNALAFLGARVLLIGATTNSDETVGYSTGYSASVYPGIVLGAMVIFRTLA